jgi:septal ring factor EnvC (AmiA/AmiB activator)
LGKTKEDIQLEYTRLCSQLGELELRKASAQDAIKDMNDQRNTITQKVRNLQKAFQALEAKEEAPTPGAPANPLISQAGIEPLVENSPKPQEESPAPPEDSNAQG